MLYEVVMYGKSNEPVAKAFVEAESLNDAHDVALRIISQQYPEIDPQLYNQTIASQIFYRSATD